MNCHPKTKTPAFRSSFLRLFPLATVAAASLLSAPLSRANAAGEVDALMYSTMPSTTVHGLEMAMDGKPGTYFKSVYGMGDGDTFLVLLTQPMAVNSIRVETGDAEGQDLLTEGFIETSTDGKTYSKVADFNAQGVANAKITGAPILGLKVRVNQRRSVPHILIKEITIDGPTKIAHVLKGPGRGFADLTEAPDLAGWAAEADRKMTESWADTAALLYTHGFITPNMVNIVYRTGPGVTDVAANGGGTMTVNSKWCRAHPEDTGLTVHEVAHSIQSMIAYNPVWLIEGIADYIRWVKYEPQNFTVNINPAKASYRDSYRTTALFLGWCELHYDSTLVTKLNTATRFGTYKDELWKQYTGKDADTLWAEFIAAYKADPNPQHILTPLVAPEDMPRELPSVKPNTSTSISLAKLFTGVGTINDTAPTTGDGIDGGGAFYSGALLKTNVTTRNGVQFTTGPVGAPNIVEARGQVVPVAGLKKSSLWLLAAAVEGAQKSQTIKVTYTDGSVAQFAQNFSDWFQPQNFPGESRAVRMPYRLMANEKDTRTFYAYSYGFKLDPTKTVQSITLPNNNYVKILAVSLAD